MRRSGRAATLAVLGCLLATACETAGDGPAFDLLANSPEPSARDGLNLPLRVYRNPYDAVDWSNDLRLTAQHHDHIALRSDYILAYDAAGYDVVSLMDYSGNSSLPYAHRQRMWPVSEWVPQEVLTALKNIQLFLPNAEEIGIERTSARDPLKHATSPFLTAYVEGAVARVPDGALEQPLHLSQYRTVEQLFALIRSNGGFPCLAHPWNYRYDTLDLGDAYCVEIYNAFGDALREQGLSWYASKDRNEVTVAAWDRALIANQRVLGIAVNDHFGPYTPAGVVSNRVRDSGKIVVLAKSATLSAYRSAFEAGSFLAVRDHGEIKNRYPTVHSITVDKDYVFIETTDAVTWIANGNVVGNDPLLRYATLPRGVRYLRAEIVNSDGSKVYTQAFAVRPLGDVDGDYDADSADDVICLDDQDPRFDLAAQEACAARILDH